jgi:hypothetical protein
MASTRVPSSATRPRRRQILGIGREDLLPSRAERGRPSLQRAILGCPRRRRQDSRGAPRPLAERPHVRFEVVT